MRTLRRAAWVGLFILPGLWATIVREMDFLAIHRAAATLVHGRCLARTEHPEAKPIPYTEYEFEVVTAVKGCRDARGEVLPKLAFRHAGTRVGVSLGGGVEAAPLHFGLPEYQVGDEVVLFLTKESGLGLSAPVGLSQGHFSVTERDGRKSVRNAAGLRKALSGVTAADFRALGKGARAALAESADEMDLESFLELVKSVKDPP